MTLILKSAEIIQYKSFIFEYIDFFLFCAPLNMGYIPVIIIVVNFFKGFKSNLLIDT